ncbi:unnamed protein product [Tilletia controversa]|uniref:Uncharacterized protein n=3 Tax=Tilletia TaxID=13289 RepID=A0A8X7MUD1_9BASI|nr:hypothetical protein CF336_g3081 [Tilletia laevis]KAE8200827.1 hypothetical protein CF328_g2851 [Tilletia controversa]KAE8262458.1 hypothetical protein A4X03_0g2435 [Tilletia caries]KAE8205672.1 hypothetical protein CF335_g2229 [Tilletia laevis]KAE8248796.1 hypothetical protein A4X06_0g3524 [Tilletia controversa]
MSDAHTFSNRRANPPQTPLNSTAFGNPSWGPTTVPPAPKIPSRARQPLAAAAAAAAESSSTSSSSGRPLNELERATQLSSRMAMAIQASNEAEAAAIYSMQVDEDPYQSSNIVGNAPPAPQMFHPAASVPYSTVRRDSSSSGFGSLHSHQSGSDMFNPTMSTRSSRTTLADSIMPSGPLTSTMEQDSPRRKAPSGAYMQPAGDSRTAHLFPSLQPAFTPFPPSKSSARERRRAHSPNEPLDSDEEERMCLRFDPAMLHRCPDLQFPAPTASLGLSMHLPAPPTPPQQNHDHMPLPSLNQQPQFVDSNMDILRATTPVSSPLMGHNPVETSQQPIVPESPALRTRSKTRFAAAFAAAIAASASSAANPQHSRSGGTASFASVPVRMSSLSTVSTSQEQSASSLSVPQESSSTHQQTTAPSKSRNQLSVRTRRQAQKDREGDDVPPAAATLARPPQPTTNNPVSSPTTVLSVSASSLRRKRNGGRMRAFDPTPTPSPPPSTRPFHPYPGSAGRSQRRVNSRCRSTTPGMSPSMDVSMEF